MWKTLDWVVLFQFFFLTAEQKSDKKVAATDVFDYRTGIVGYNYKCFVILTLKNSLDMVPHFFVIIFSIQRFYISLSSYSSSFNSVTHKIAEITDCQL